MPDKVSQQRMLAVLQLHEGFDPGNGLHEPFRAASETRSRYGSLVPRFTKDARRRKEIPLERWPLAAQGAPFGSRGQLSRGFIVICSAAL